MRTLSFLSGSTAYELLYQALNITERRFTPLEVNLLGRLQDKFEAVGVPKKIEGRETPVRKMGVIIPHEVVEDCEVKLEEAEFSLLNEAFREAYFTPVVAREVAATHRFLKECKEDKAIKAEPKEG
ncbi:MAG: hypothetical protein KIS74_03055 [Burkholderiales bacterium]|nr:hypothetical protein [Burkholderiales bacterium]